jgi:hypothetical protein
MTVTQLDSEDVGSVTWFDEHDLILMGQVKRLAIISSDGKVKRSRVDLRDRRELGDTGVPLSNQFCPSESKLGIADIASGNKDRAVVDRNGDDSL